MDRLFANALYTQEGYPCRLTQHQRDWYHAQSSEFAARADCTAGVSLRFVTDAPVLRFSYEVISYCRSCNVCDLYEDGVHTRSVRLADMQSRGEAVFVRGTQGRRRIDVVLPNTCGLRLTKMDFGDWQPVPQGERRILLLGDSILQGIQSYHPSCSLGHQLLRMRGADGINQSVGGARFSPEVLEILPYQPDSVFVALGTNDAFSGDDAFEEKIPAYFGKLRALYPALPITAVTPIHCMALAQDDALYRRFARVRALIHQEGAAVGAQVIDGSGLVPHAPRFFNEDGIHPNDLGFMHYAVNLHRVQI